MKIKEQTFKDFVPLEIHNKVKKQLNDIVKRHSDFRSLLTVNNQTTSNQKSADLMQLADRFDKTSSLFPLDLNINNMTNPVKEVRAFGSIQFDLIKLNLVLYLIFC